MTLTQRAQSAIHANYAAAGLPEVWPTALEVIAACFNFVGRAFMLDRSHDGVHALVRSLQCA